jgi:putative transposase
LKQLEDENAKLKKLLAEQMLDAAALRELLAKNGRARRQARRRRASAGRDLSERRACSLVDADRKMTRYRSRRAPDTELRTQLRDLANARRRFGYRRCSSCCGRTANRPGSTGSTGFIAKRA